MYDTLHQNKFYQNCLELDANPQAILDKVSGEVFDLSVMTLIHLGAKNIRLYPEDLDTEEPIGDEFILLGRPSMPAAFAQYLHKFAEV